MKRFIIGTVLVAGILFAVLQSRRLEIAPPEVAGNSKSSVGEIKKVTSSSKELFQSKIFKHVAQVRDQQSDPARNGNLSDHELADRKLQEAMRAYGKDNSRAKELLEEARKLDRYNAGVLRVLSGIVLNEGNKDEARLLASECIAVDRRNLECHATLVSSYTRHGEFEDAYPVLSDCLLDTPGNIHCLGGMESYHLQGNRLNEAKAVLDQMAQSDPNSLWTVLAQATYFEKAGDLHAAKDKYRLACEKGQAFACQRLKEMGREF